MRKSSYEGAFKKKMREFLTVKEVAEMLNLSERTIRDYMKKRIIPYVKLPGGSIRFPKDEIDKWVETSFRSPGTENTVAVSTLHSSCYSH